MFDLSKPANPCGEGLLGTGSGVYSGPAACFAPCPSEFRCVAIEHAGGGVVGSPRYGVSSPFGFHLNPPRGGTPTDL